MPEDEGGRLLLFVGPDPELVVGGVEGAVEALDDAVEDVDVVVPTEVVADVVVGAATEVEIEAGRLTETVVFP